jgi:hypothetical protein
MKEENNKIIQEKKENKKIMLNKDIDLYKISFNTIKETKISDFKGELFNEILNEVLKSEGNNQNQLVLNKQINKNNQTIKKIIINKKKTGPKSPDKNYKSLNVQKMHSYNKNISDNPNIIKKVKVANSSYVNNKSMLKGKYITLREFKIEKIIFQMRYNTQMGEDLGVIGSINDLGCWDQGRALRMTWNKGNIWRGTIVFNNNQIIDFEYKFIFISKGYVKQWEEGNNRKFILSQIKGLIESCPGGGTIIHLKNISGLNIDFNYNDYTLTIICEWNKK